MSAARSCCLGCDRCCARFCVFAGPILSVIVGWCICWNAAKLPFYWPGDHLPMTNVTYNASACLLGIASPTVCHGVEATPQLHWLIGYRSAKVYASPSLFLVPHVCMGITLLGTLILVLLEPSTLLSRSYLFLPLAFLFGLHVIPVEDGIPDPQLGGFHMNAVFVVCLWFGVLTSAVGLKLMRTQQPLARNVDDSGHPAKDRFWQRDAGRRVLVAGWSIISGALLAAPLFEFDLIAKACEGYNVIWGGYDANSSMFLPAPWQGNVPDPASGRGPYASSGCPATIGWLFSLMLLAAGSVYCVGYSSGKLRARQRRRLAEHPHASSVDSDAGVGIPTSQKANALMEYSGSTLHEAL